MIGDESQPLAWRSGAPVRPGTVCTKALADGWLVVYLCVWLQGETMALTAMLIQSSSLCKCHSICLPAAHYITVYTPGIP